MDPSGPLFLLFFFLILLPSFIEGAPARRSKERKGRDSHKGTMGKRGRLRKARKAASAQREKLCDINILKSTCPTNVVELVSVFYAFKETETSSTTLLGQVLLKIFMAQVSSLL